ncbi:hypothetical protein GPECTOR_1g825 [Gonium pectorale]|uniref:C5orf34-like C-terminal domain-containing protein n=1 Tax=Gonium pectorale TaxID=33097 RepID=A0A150H4G5_GONPE|nr:hypothetical protein GPECTOR_1g825 [Gonium pectorale]|eukprot:KXZ56915.1 hypothetical protein GPECTOR_1g825 [Gonium pectorale]
MMVCKLHNASVAAAVAARLPLAPLAPPVLGSAAASATALLPTSSPDELFAVASSAVLEESDVPGHGHFTAYEDGRVRACFGDRTILHMSASHSHCKVVLPDGASVVVAVANPVGVERCF